MATEVEWREYWSFHLQTSDLGKLLTPASITEYDLIRKKSKELSKSREVSQSDGIINVSKQVSVFLRRRKSEVTERRVHASRKRCPFSCRLKSPLRWCLDCTAGREESSTSEVQRLQKFYRRNCGMFAAPRKSERQLTAESAECCRTRGSSHLPSREAPARTATGEPDMRLWTWYALGWVANGVRVVAAWCDHDVACHISRAVAFCTDCSLRSRVPGKP